MTGVYLVASIFLWWFIGCVVCAALDTEEQPLFKWALSGPRFCGPTLVVMFWPVVVVIFLLGITKRRKF